LELGTKLENRLKNEAGFVGLAFVPVSFVAPASVPVSSAPTPQKFARLLESAPGGHVVGHLLTPVHPAFGILIEAHAAVFVLGVEHVVMVRWAVLPSRLGSIRRLLAGRDVLADILMAEARSHSSLTWCLTIGIDMSEVAAFVEIADMSIGGRFQRLGVDQRWKPIGLAKRIKIIENGFVNIVRRLPQTQAILLRHGQTGIGTVVWRVRLQVIVQKGAVGQRPAADRHADRQHGSEEDDLQNSRSRPWREPHLPRFPRP